MKAKAAGGQFGAPHLSNNFGASVPGFIVRGRKFANDIIEITPNSHSNQHRTHLAFASLSRICQNIAC